MSQTPFLRLRSIAWRVRPSLTTIAAAAICGGFICRTEGGSFHARHGMTVP